MTHLIEFCSGFIADLEVAPSQRMQRVRIPRGMRVYAYPVPFVAESIDGPVEAADLHFEDGSVVRRVRYEHFRFVD